MYPNFKEILSELSYRVEGGIPDLNKESHVNILIDNSSFNNNSACECNI